MGLDRLSGASPSASVLLVLVTTLCMLSKPLACWGLLSKSVD